MMRYVIVYQHKVLNRLVFGCFALVEATKKMKQTSRKVYQTRIFER